MDQPPIFSRIEERADAILFETQAGNVRTLPCVAADAGECEIVRRGTPAVLAADDVIDLMRRERVFFMDEAIFATTSCSAGDKQSHIGWDFGAHGRRLRLETDLRSRLGHDHEVFESQVFLEFLILAGRNGAFAPAVDQFSDAGLSLLGRAEVGNGFSGGSSGEKIKDFVDSLRQCHPTLHDIPLRAVIVTWPSSPEPCAF